MKANCVLFLPDINSSKQSVPNNINVNSISQCAIENADILSALEVKEDGEFYYLLILFNLII